jgi:WD40 repeat protein
MKNLNSEKYFKKFEGHTHRINYVKELDNKRIITFSDDETIKIWEKESGEFFSNKQRSILFRSAFK